MKPTLIISILFCFFKNIWAHDYSASGPRWCSSSRCHYFQTLTEAPGVLITALMSNETLTGWLTYTGGDGGRSGSSVIFLQCFTDDKTTLRVIMSTKDNENKGRMQTSLCCLLPMTLAWLFCRYSLPIDTREHAACGFAGMLSTKNNGGAEWHLFSGATFSVRKHSGRIKVQSERLWFKTTCHRWKHGYKLQSIISHVHWEQKNVEVVKRYSAKGSD